MILPCGAPVALLAGSGLKPEGTVKSPSPSLPGSVRTVAPATPVEPAVGAPPAPAVPATPAVPVAPAEPAGPIEPAVPVAPPAPAEPPVLPAVPAPCPAVAAPAWPCPPVPVCPICPDCPAGPLPAGPPCLIPPSQPLEKPREPERQRESPRKPRQRPLMPPSSLEAHGRRRIGGPTNAHPLGAAARGLERERELSAPTHRRLGPDAAAVPADDAAHDREADPRALELRGAVEPLERLEQAAREGWVEADAVVLHEVNRLGAARDADLDAGARAFPRELPGVAQQVLEDDLQQARVAQRLEGRGDDHLDGPRRRSLAQLADDGLDDGREIDGQAAHGRA